MTESEWLLVQTMDQEPLDKDDLAHVAEGLALAAKEWDFTPDEELPGGHCSRVFASGGLVLKVAYRGEERTSGLKAALAWSGKGGPLVHRSHPMGLILMERIIPGTPLAHPQWRHLDDLTLIADLVKSAPFMPREEAGTLEDWFEERTPLVAALLDSTSSPRCLHGDLHHSNVLWNGTGWTVIDPKGLWGDPSFEAIACLRNPLDLLLEVEDLAGWTRGRLGRICQLLDLPEDRVFAWALADSLADEPTPGGPWARYREALLSLASEWPEWSSLAGLS